MNQQEEMFHQWKNTCDSIGFLRGVIQNDFNRMLEDGHITKPMIAAGIVEFQNNYERLTSELYNLKVKIVEFLTEKSK
jgi:hypothetical protein